MAYDKNAPRFRREKYAVNLITDELIKEFKNKYPEYKELPDSKIKKDIKKMFEEVANEAITNPLGIKLPNYIGELKLQYIPYDFKAVDQTTSAELGERVNFLNIETRKKVARIIWTRRWAVKFNRMLQFYAFEPSGVFGHKANEYVLKNPEKLRVARNTTGGKSAWK